MHPENGEKLLLRLAADVEEIARVETPPKLDGRNMTMVMSPLKEAVTQKPRSPSPKPRPESAAKEEAPAPRPRPIKVTRAEGG